MTKEERVILHKAIAIRADYKKLSIKLASKKLGIDQVRLNFLYADYMHEIKDKSPGMSISEISKKIGISKCTGGYLFNYRITVPGEETGMLPIEQFNETLHSRYMNTIFAFGGFGIYKGLTE